MTNLPHTYPCAKLEKNGIREKGEEKKKAEA